MSHQQTTSGYDRQEPPALGIGVALVSILVFTIIPIFVLIGVFERFQRDEYHEKVEAAPNPQWDALRNGAEQQLSSYGFVDKEKQVVHLPIARAMELTVQEIAGRAEQKKASETEAANKGKGKHK